MNYKPHDARYDPDYSARHGGERIDFIPVDLAAVGYEVVECSVCYALISAIRIQRHAGTHLDAREAPNAEVGGQIP